jgi:HTH-type transcriptional regulator/antitoxin HipB
MRQLIITPDQIGQVLRSARRAQGLSQAEAGVQLGLSQSRLSELEKGAATITVAQLLSMIALYNLQLEVATRRQQHNTAW